MTDTTQFFLDGSPNGIGFHAREKPDSIVWEQFRVPVIVSMAGDNVEITVLRPVLFFYAQQKITMGKLKEFFTDKAIALLSKDGYIKIKTNI